jgi:hypothetical protein
MKNKPVVLRTTVAAVFVLVGLNGACDADELPACPGQCFAYTIERAAPAKCLDDETTNYEISFTNTNPNGYHGRFCFNSSSVALVVEAIDHLEAGGQLSDLGMDVVGAYLSTVNAVKADLEAECITAAPGQCINADQVCMGVAADMYEQLVAEQSCVLALAGTEPVVLGPGQSCEAVADDPTTGPTDAGGHCLPVSSTTIDTGVDDTSDSSDSSDTSSADETSSGIGRTHPVSHQR